MDAYSLLSSSIHFVLPDDRHLPSGGNIYNAHLIAALKSLGQVVEIIDFATYREAILLDKAGIYGVDSLFVEDMKALSNIRAEKAFSFFLLHHLPSLYPPAGVSADQLFEMHEKKVLDFFQAFLLSSDYSQEYLQSRGIGAPMVVVEPANTPTVSEFPVLPDSPLKGLMVANVVARKGILPFLEALASRTKAQDDFVLNIIGRQDMEPAYADACRQYVEAEVLKGKVHFKGSLSHQETLQQYAKHHVFLSAAYMETFGMAIQEAKARGLPLLLCGGGYTKKHLTSGAGMLCINISDLAGNFLKLGRNHSQLSELYQSARIGTTHEAYTWKQAAAHFLNFLGIFLK